MAYFIEEVLRDMGGMLDEEVLREGEGRIAEFAFLRFSWFHEVILPIGFYSYFAQIMALARVADELLFYIDPHFYYQINKEAHNFISQSLAGFFGNNRNIHNKVMEILCHHGG